MSSPTPPPVAAKASDVSVPEPVPVEAPLPQPSGGPTATGLAQPRYRSLQPQKIVMTAEHLERRIGDRFPNAGLRQVARELTHVAGEAIVRCERIRRPLVWLRAVCFILVATLLGVLVGFGLHVKSNGDELTKVDAFAQTLEATLGSIFFIGATLAFLFSLERRIKRERALRAMHELRAIAHIVDMHQLTKDPETLLRGSSTPSSPHRTLTQFELGRYLDYCSELLSLISKIGALYVQEFPDSTAVDAADQLAALTNGLSRTIWQKIIILDRTLEPRTESNF